MTHLVRLPIAAIGAAGTRVVESAEKTGSAEVTGCKAFVNLSTTNREYQVSIGKKPGSLVTGVVIEADKARDRAVVGLRDNVHAKTFWPDTQTAAAANKLEPLVLKYSANIENEPYNEESTLIHTFLAKLAEPEWQEAIELLGIRPLIDHLSQAQQNFESVQRNRTLSTAAESEVAAASNKRRDLEKAIRAFTMYVAAMDLVSPDSVWHALNLTITQQLTEIERGYRTSGKQSQSNLDKG